MPTDYGYCRESTQRQEESGLGREGQIAKITQLCKSSDNPFGGMFIDSAVSGNIKMTDREAGKELDRIVRRGDRIIVSRLDRAFRRTVDALEMVERWNALGIKFVVCDFQGQTIDFTTGMGKFILTVLVAFAELERSYISERTKIALAARKAKGLRGNSNEAGYGFKWVNVNDRVRKRVPDEEALELMRSFYEWHYELGMSLDHIRQHIQFSLKIHNKWGKRLRNKNGRWCIGQIRNWIQAEHRRRLAAGEPHYGFEEEGPDPEDQWAGLFPNANRDEEEGGPDVTAAL